MSSVLGHGVFWRGGACTALHKLFGTVVNKLLFLAIMSEQRVKVILGEKNFENHLVFKDLVPKIYG